MKVPPAFLAAGSDVTWNPADTHPDITLSNGNLTATKGVSAATRCTRATVGILAAANGYFEVQMQGTETVAKFRMVGIAPLSTLLTSYPGGDAVSYGYYEDTGQKYTNAVGAAYGATYTNGDVISVAFKNGSLWFAKNGVYQAGGDPAADTGAAFTGITGTVYPMLELYAVSAVHIATARFKTSDFSYSPPSGFAPWGQ